MNINELDSYRLDDAVKFHNRLNPRLWDDSEHLRSDVKDKLLEIAADFQQFLGIPDLDVKDITVSGSNAAYNYTPSSDIDLHLVVDLPEADKSEVYRELFDAKKYQYNNQHNIKIGGFDVELYVQNPNEEHHSQGIYSLKNNNWVSVPKRRKPEVDDISVKSKVEDLAARIDDAVQSDSYDSAAALMSKIKDMRKAGLAKEGEYGSDNLAFKVLRNQGYIKKLVDARTAARDAELSLAEQNKVKTRVRYGFAEDVTVTPDGVSASTKMFLEDEGTKESIVNDFIAQVAEQLGITEMPTIQLHDDPAWSEQEHSFGRYTPETHTLEVNLAGRHIMDILRTTAHELAHCRQNQDSLLPNEAGATGSKWENEAHSVAGIVMRHYARQHPEMFDAAQVNEASGYIPTNAQKNDPRFKMALTVDIHPGQTGKEANKMALQTDAQGKPALLMKTANLQESLERELALFEQDLFEIKMTGKNLAKLASDIKGAKIGLEFEMIVPNATVDDEPDMEPDYDQDERVRDIDDAVNFFDDGDYNSNTQLSRLRSAMESDYQDWVIGKMDEAWDNNGMEFFQEFLDREYPFDRDDAFDTARDEIITANPDLPPESDEFQQLVSARVDEMEANYYVEQWEEQGRYYDYAREEFDDEQRDSLSESDWLSDQGIRYASEVESNYGHVTWPYYTTMSDEGDADIERIALEFMNESGLPYDSVAVSSNYHGTYKKWVGNGWVSVGSEKPDDCFSIEPDGSLDGDDSSDVGLEFVSPPIPLEQVGDVMSKVQKWAARNGVYTGKNNKTSMHTNISVPGYDLKNLDYLKAALLLGDEYVLREFDRIGNTYAKPAIEKIKSLVSQKPEKAQELLDRMKSHLNAEASKLIHSGTTDKFTSINTKNNRIEFRSPGGDYLSDIADNPKKMQDMINRMVVTMDAAMDTNKYKQEYQKKLYKMLTGQQFGREAKSGAKQEAKKDTNDLLNLFSRYAAGELPKSALKSFVRQAQLQRSVTKGKTGGKMWWNVSNPAQSFASVEVVASTKEEAIEKALGPDGYPSWANTRSTVVAKPLRPYEEKPAAPENGSTGNWGIWITASDRFARRPGTGDPGIASLRRFPSLEAAIQFLEQMRADNPRMRTDVEAREIPADYQMPGAPVGREVVPIPGSTLDLQRQRAAQIQDPGPAPDPIAYEMYRISDGRAVEANGIPIQFHALTPEDAERKLRIYAAAHSLGAPELFDVRSVLQVPAQQDTWSQDFERRMQNPAPVEPRTEFGAGTADQQQGGTVDVAGEQPAQEPRRVLTVPGHQPGQVFTGEWKVVDANGQELYRFSGVGNSQLDANRVAAQWLRNNGMYLSNQRVEVLPVMGEA